VSAPDPLALWDGRWTVAKPADYVAGLYRMHQVAARWLLKNAERLTEADARLLQAVAYQAAPLSNLQRYWLERIESEQAQRKAA
jgi:hypothetical protein